MSRATGGVARVLGADGEPVEVVIAAPAATPGGIKVAGPKTFSLADLKREMEVYAPPTPEEIAEAAMRIAQEEHDDAETQRVMAATITNVTCCLARMLVEAGLARDAETIEIPRWLVDRMEGAKLGISETADRDLILRWRPRAERPIEPEEMRGL